MRITRLSCTDLRLKQCKSCSKAENRNTIHNNVSLYFSIRIDIYLYNTICSDLQELTAGASDIELDDIKTKLAELQQQVLSRVKAGKDTTELAEEIQQLRERKNEIETAKSEQQRDENRVAALRESIDKAKDKVLAYDEQLVRNFIEEIKVFPDKLTITVKGGAHEDITI
jgi:hypothetical protein